MGNLMSLFQFNTFIKKIVFDVQIKIAKNNKVFNKSNTKN